MSDPNTTASYYVPWTEPEYEPLPEVPDTQVRFGYTGDGKSVSLTLTLPREVADLPDWLSRLSAKADEAAEAWTRGGEGDDLLYANAVLQPLAELLSRVAAP